MAVNIKDLKRFPTKVTQKDQTYGCIPASVTAVMTYHDAKANVSEDLVLSRWTNAVANSGGKLKMCNISFGSLAEHVLEPRFGNDWKFEVEVRENYSDWMQLVEENVRASLPPIIAWISAVTKAHATPVLGYNSDRFLVHDPFKGKGDVLWRKSLENVRCNDVLIISRR